MLADFLKVKSKSVTFSANLLAISSFVSALLGLMRNRLLAGLFGASHQTDVYLAAFRIPDLVYAIFVLGGISVAFLPLFAEYAQNEDKKSAFDFANNLLNVLFVGLVAGSSLLAVFSPFLVPLVTPGFSFQDQTLTASLMRVMFLSPIFFGISSVLSGISQYFNRFFASALAPIVYNLSIIGGIIFLTPPFGIWGASLGVAGGAIFYFLVQLPPALHSGFSFKPALHFFDAGVLKTFRLAVPRLPGAIAYQINLIAMTAFASTFSVGSITVFGFANDIQSFPINLIGVPFALAAFPALARAFAQKSIDQFRSAFSGAFSEILFLALPMGVVLFLLRAQIIRLSYGVGKFGWWETRLTAAALGIFMLGVLFQALIPLLARAFFSAKNTKIPTLAGVFAVGVNIALALAFMHVLSFENFFRHGAVVFLRLEGILDIRVLALPLALLVSGVVQFGTLLFLLEKKMHGLFARAFLSDFFKTFVAVFALGVATYGALWVFGKVFALHTAFQVLMQTFIAMVAGGSAFLCVAWILKVPQLKSIFYSLKNQFNGE